MKTCTCCKQEKELEAFAAVSNNRKSTQCKECLNAKARKRRENRHYSRSKVIKVRKTDADMANDLTTMKW